MSDWQTDLAALTECYDSHDALSKQLGFERSRVGQIIDDPSSAGPEFKESVSEHREELREQNTIALDVGIRCIQTLEWVLERDPDEEEIRQKKERIQQMTGKLCD